MAYPSEKKILKELLEMYKGYRCLWCPSHSGYTNKVTRRRALQVLIEKYRELDSTADVYKMKKKIENMRTTYKRERQKVIKAQLNNEEMYEPTLWYYPLMCFLDELGPAQAVEYTDSSLVDLSVDDHDTSDDYVAPESPETKPKPTSVYITESVLDYDRNNSPKAKRTKTSWAYSSEDEAPYLIKSEPEALGSGTTAERDLFGRAMTSRLNELIPQQRFIAEKLISDVIFLGRLKKLKTGSTINVNDDTI